MTLLLGCDFLDFLVNGTVRILNLREDVVPYNEDAVLCHVLASQ